MRLSAEHQGGSRKTDVCDSLFAITWQNVQVIVLFLALFFSFNVWPVTRGRSVCSQSLPDYVPWWKSTIIYEVYLRSFKDSNGDGIGDIRGLISQLDYLQDLGVTMVWITPHYDSPNVDNGYDVRDYQKISSIFGSIEDFDQLIKAIRHRHMELMIDLVFNHTSDQHQWFQASRQSRVNPYRDYYIWHEASLNNVPNNYPSNFGGSAWEFDQRTQQYYLHYFAKQQPDLNWDNPTVRQAIYAAIRFWTDKGVRGLRFDSITTISKDRAFHNLRPFQNFLQEYGKGPHLHQYVQELNQQVLSMGQYFAIGEMTRVPPSKLALFVSPKRHELDAAINLDLIRIQRQKKPDWMYRPWTYVQFKRLIDRIDEGIGDDGWNTFFLSNHDNARSVSTFGNPFEQYRVRSAKALATILLTQRATPIIYQGDEIGMTNYPFRSLADFRDLWVFQEWKNYVETGKLSAAQYLDHLRKTGRDNARTPMQWNDSPAAGFTTGKPWINVNPNYLTVNVANNRLDPDSLFYYYQHLIRLRRQIPALVVGHYTDIAPLHPSIYAYTRTWMNERYLIVVNMSDRRQTFRLPLGERIAYPIVTSPEQSATVAQPTRTIDLSGWQAGIYRLQSQPCALGQHRLCGKDANSLALTQVPFSSRSGKTPHVSTSTPICQPAG